MIFYYKHLKCTIRLAEGFISSTRPEVPKQPGTRYYWGRNSSETGARLNQTPNNLILSKRMASFNVREKLTQGYLEVALL